MNYIDYTKVGTSNIVKGLHQMNFELFILESLQQEPPSFVTITTHNLNASPSQECCHFPQKSIETMSFHIN